MKTHFHSTSTKTEVKDRVYYANNIELTDEEASLILDHYNELHKEEGLYNPRHLPFETLATIQKQHNSVGWISMSHSADYVELAMYGPGSNLLKPFVKNTDLHDLMLHAAEVEINY